MQRNFPEISDFGNMFGKNEKTQSSNDHFVKPLNPVDPGNMPKFGQVGFNLEPTNSLNVFASNSNNSNSTANSDFQITFNNANPVTQPNSIQSESQNKSPLNFETSSSLNSSKISEPNLALFREIGNEILAKIKAKRSQDEMTNVEFRAKLTDFANEFSSNVINTVFEKNENYSKLIELKLEAISESLERVRILEIEEKSISDRIEHMYNEFKKKK